MEMIQKNRLSEAVADAISDQDGVGQAESAPETLGMAQKKTAVKKPAKKRTRAKARKRA